MEKFENFEVWLKGKHQLNWRDYVISMGSIEKVLMVPGFEKISSVSILNQLMAALRKNVNFNAKAKTEQAKELKAFKFYIQFIEEEREARKSEQAGETE